MRRIEVSRTELFILIGTLALVSSAAWLWSQSFALAAALGIGAAVATLQTMRGMRARQLSGERRQVIDLLQEVGPLVAAGEALHPAVISVAGKFRDGPVRAIGLALERMQTGMSVTAASSRLKGNPLSVLLFKLVLFQRRNGGDPRWLVDTLRKRLELSAELEQRRELALVQIQWQATAITVIFGLVLVAAFLRAGPLIAALFETGEGRSIVATAAAMILWGRVALTALEESIQ